MRLAIIGTGISGLTAAHLLHHDHELTLFEADDRIGGHTNTVEVVRHGQAFPVDTGFIVCNERTYPNFLALMRQLGVALRPTVMTFSVQVPSNGLEWAGADIDALFCQRRNLFRFSFLRMVRDILRFNREALDLLADGEEMPLGDWLRHHGYSQAFIDHYIVPMGGAIWSSSPGMMLAFPARFFVRFFHHHGMLTINDRPQWFTVAGGSRSYLAPLTAPFSDRIRRRTPVTALRRDGGGVMVTTAAGSERFDGAVMACHADQALRLIGDPSTAEQRILSAFPYIPNDAVLHTDERIMPRSRKAWSAWNVRVPKATSASVAVTYDLNLLQGHDHDPHFLVSLNETDIDPTRVIRRIQYHHPLFTVGSPRAQACHGEINGVNHLWFCGAYWRNGFHEDGVWSAVQAVSQLTHRRLAGAA